MANVKDYTIGCICAIVDEAVALRSFFDETQVCPKTKTGKTYTTGTIGSHKVVIARLPLGSYGTSDATSVIVHMAADFPNVRFCLMVGIGGGAPDPERPSHDIRLGDIVVSSPGNRMGGVIQYDHGKAIQDQPFRSTQHLNRPPDALLEAVSILAENYQLDGHNLQGMVKLVLDNNPRLMQQGFQRPDESSDRLYKPEYVHRMGANGSCSTVCGGNPEHLVSRPPRASRIDDPMVFRGIIASGSRVVKDAQFRDALAKEKGVLCFEMEAAGLMNRLPCLVIRGICDYSDSHKNDSWQKYAAMMAAAFATEVLNVLQPQTVAAERKIGEALEGQ
jgi:nucleoside phosphorylase